MISFREWLLTESTHSFSSTQVNFTPADTATIQKWSKQHIKDEDLYTDDEMGRETESHVTVLYGLHADTPDEVSKIVKKAKPFDIKLGKVSKFASDKYDVIKLDIEGKELHKLHKALETLPYTSKFIGYKPHCTIAYVKKGSCDKLLGNTAFAGKTIRVKNVLFSSKTRQKTKITL